MMVKSGLKNIFEILPGKSNFLLIHFTSKKRQLLPKLQIQQQKRSSFRMEGTQKQFNHYIFFHIDDMCEIKFYAEENFIVEHDKFNKTTAKRRRKTDGSLETIGKSKSCFRIIDMLFFQSEFDDFFWNSLIFVYKSYFSINDPPAPSGGCCVGPQPTTTLGRWRVAIFHKDKLMLKRKVNELSVSFLKNTGWKCRLGWPMLWQITTIY